MPNSANTIPSTDAQPASTFVEQVDTVIVADIEQFGSISGTSSETGTTAYRADMQTARALARILERALNP